MVQIWGKARQRIFANCEAALLPRLGDVGSAVQLAWGHALCCEAARACNVACLQVDVDLEKAYDSVDLDLLTAEGLAVGVPPNILCLSLMSYLHPRRLQSGREVGPLVYASRGVIAGSASAVSELAIMLRKPFLRATQASAPRDVSLYVDDSTAAFVGPPRQAARRAARFGVALARELARVRLTMSTTKSIVTGTPYSAVNDAARRVRASGIRPVRSAKRLGVETAQGGRPTRRLTRLRARPAPRRLVRVLRLRAAGARAVHLYKTCIAAAMKYGDEVVGVTEGSLQQRRRLAARAAFPAAYGV